jgi:hypothetical protein
MSTQSESTQITPQSYEYGLWAITVHFQRFPHLKILKCDSTEQCKDIYFQSLKQALHLIHGSTYPVNALTLIQQQHLWESCSTCNYLMYSSASAAFVPTVETIRIIPVRYIRQDKPTLQRPIFAFDKETNKEITLENAIRILLFLTGEETTNVNIESHLFRIQGVIVPLEAPIFEVWKDLCHADMFLYIVSQI